ncbi:MAG: HEAT repeat domain-containing protein [Candidatus Ozemobacteraceae bacterium]
MIVRDDTVFAQALQFAESADPVARLNGVEMLSEIGDSRCLEVVRVLQNDEDPDVRAAARPVYQGLIKKGFRPRVRPGDELHREKTSLSNTTEILDEAFFLISRNFDRIAAASLRSGFLKIVAAVLLIGGRVLWPTDGLWFEREIFGAALWIFLAHQLLVRPYAWETIGRAILANYPEKSVRKAAVGEFSHYRYQRMFMANILQRGCMVLPVIIFWKATMGTFYLNFDGSAFIFAGLAFMAVVLYLNPVMLPLHVLTSKSAGATISESTELVSQKRFVLKAVYPNFLALTFGMYTLAIINVLFILQYFFDINHSGCILGAVLIADVVIDPVWMAFRLMITRMMMNSSTMEGV